MTKVIGTTINNEIIVFESEEAMKEYNDKLAAQVLENSFSTVAYREEEKK